MLSGVESSPDMTKTNRLLRVRRHDLIGESLKPRITAQRIEEWVNSDHIDIIALFFSIAFLKRIDGFILVAERHVDQSTSEGVDERAAPGFNRAVELRQCFFPVTFHRIGLFQSSHRCRRIIRDCQIGCIYLSSTLLLAWS